MTGGPAGRGAQTGSGGRMLRAPKGEAVTVGDR